MPLCSACLGTEQWVTSCPCAQPEEVEPFVRSLQAVPKSGLHNPLKNPDRCARAWRFFCLTSNSAGFGIRCLFLSAVKLLAARRARCCLLASCASCALET